jgi:methionine-rich copper-binding protein CopC
LSICGSTVAASTQNNSSSENYIVHNQSQVYSEGTLTIRGYWINNGVSVLNTMNVSALKDAGVTDLFISTDKSNVQGSVEPFLNKFNNSGIRIHAWIGCFKNGTAWYDPGTNPDLVNKLINTIISISTNYNISGIHLDSVRYPGTAYKYNGTQHVTDFTQDVYNIIQNINSQNIPNKNNILLSAALMPETNHNGYYYGQDYGMLAPYLDFLVPMIYKGNYQAGTSWIGSTTKYIVQAAGGKPVVAGIQTYRSDDYPVPISASELNTDIQTALDNGSSGYVLFKYGLTDTSTSGVPFYSNTYHDDIFQAAAYVKAYIEKYENLPSQVSLSSSLADYVDMPTFLYLLTKSLNYLDSGKTTSSIRVIDYNDPTSPLETVKSGTLNKSEYLDIANSILYYMKSKGYAPGYRNSSLDNIPYQNLIYAYSKILNYYDLNGVLPSSVSVKPLLWPDVKTTDPAENSTKIPISYPITITFDENIKAGANYSGIYLKNLASGSKISITKTIVGNTLIINSNKLYFTSYQVYLPEGAVKNSVSNSLISAYSFKFTTIPPDTAPPVVSKTSPTNNATGVSLTTPVTITFNENIVKSGNYSGIYLKNILTGAKVSITTSISGKILTIKQASSRLYNTTYQVCIPAGSVKDVYGNRLKNEYTFTFTTQPKDTTPPVISKTSPTNNATGVSLNTPITITFSENIISGSKFSGIYIKNLDTGKIVSLTSKTISGKTLTIKMTSSRISKNNYLVYLPAGAVKDAAGNLLKATYSFKFKTA